MYEMWNICVFILPSITIFNYKEKVLGEKAVVISANKIIQENTIFLPMINDIFVLLIRILAVDNVSFSISVYKQKLIGRDIEYSSELRTKLPYGKYIKMYKKSS